MSAPFEPRLTREQQALFLEHTGWRERTVRRLVRRFSKWVPEDEIDGIVLLKSMECATRWDEARGVPFPAYALKAVTYTVVDRARQAQQHLAQAYKACSSCSELALTDPRAIHGTEEERKAEIGKIASRLSTAVLVAGAFSRDTAAGGEDAMIHAVDRARVLRAIDDLQERRREVLQRRYGNGEEPVETTAKEMGLGAITVRRAHDEALDELRERFL